MWGLNAHRRWHYRGPAGPPPGFVLWFLRFRFEPIPATFQNLCTRALYTITCLEMPWHVEAREEEEAAAEERAMTPARIPPLTPLTRAESLRSVAEGEPDSPLSRHVPAGRDGALVAKEVEKEEDGLDGLELDEEEADDIRFKRGITAVGFVAVYVSWVRFRPC